MNHKPSSPGSDTPGRVCTQALAILLLLISALILPGPSMARTLSLPDALPEGGTAAPFHRSMTQLAEALRDEPALSQSVAVALLIDDLEGTDDALAIEQDNPSSAVGAMRLIMALMARARVDQPEAAIEAFVQRLSQRLRTADPVTAHGIGYLMNYDLARDVASLNILLGRLPKGGIDPTDTEADYRPTLIRLTQIYATWQFLQANLPLARGLIAADRARRYHIVTDALIDTPDGITLSAMVVRPRQLDERHPTILSATIYSNPQGNLHRAIEAAAHGYIGVVSDSRGKRLGRGPRTPYENESGDVHAVIDWITGQPWSDGRVGMYGGSYLGYTQWAATRSKHPALKTIVPSAAAMPGQGLPMVNNIFQNANYPWTAFVTNDAVNDDSAYELDWRAAAQQWYAEGRPYREFDQIAGEANPWLQKWLRHPAFDDYWQSMIPTPQDYAELDIPVLTITGYYDDGQISALQYLQDHYRHNPDAKHFLIIGPYDHSSTQISPDASLRGYELDDVALIDVRRITFQWFDHVFRGAPRPAILRERINYQLMGDNSWQHVKSLSTLQQAATPYYLTTSTQGAYQALAPLQPSELDASRQVIDLSDRSGTHNNHYYPYPIVLDALNIDSGVAFATAPFERDMALSGILEGQLEVRINKKDFDIGLVLFEITASGQFFHLGYALGRASFAADPSRRQLLTPGQIESIPVPRTHMVSRKIAAGSRLLLLVDVNVNPFAQVNYGTGGDVSDEAIDDAGDPLQVEWFNSSFVRLPIEPLEGQLN